MVHVEVTELELVALLKHRDDLEDEDSIRPGKIGEVAVKNEREDLGHQMINQRPE